MAPAIKIPKPNKTGTPKGMEGVRPGSPQAIKAGYKPPKPPKGPGKPGGAPFAVSFNADGTTTLKPPAAPAAAAAPPAPTTTTVTTPGTPPNAAWWNSQYTSDPSFLLTDPVLRAAQNQTSTNYGYNINRDTTEGSPTKGQAYYRVPKIDPVTKKPVLDETGKPVYLATGILQTFDDAGKPVYKDATGKVYAPADLEMDITRIARGEAGYLEGALGAAEAASENNQFRIGDAAARAGLRSSGMRASASSAESSALQSALSGLTKRAAGELTGIDKQYADMFSSIFKGLAPQAAALAAPTTTTVETPAAAPAAPTAETPVAPTYAGQPTDQTSYAGYGQPQSGSTLSAGPGGQFLKMIDDITVSSQAAGGGTFGWKDQVSALEQMKKTYSLTPRQIKYLDDKIGSIRKANVKTSNTTIPPAKPKPSKGKGK